MYVHVYVNIQACAYTHRFRRAVENEADVLEGMKGRREGRKRGREAGRQGGRQEGRSKKDDEGRVERTNTVLATRCQLSTKVVYLEGRKGERASRIERRKEGIKKGKMSRKESRKEKHQERK
jgi:hypothetical protein